MYADSFVTRCIFCVWIVRVMAKRANGQGKASAIFIFREIYCLDNQYIFVPGGEVLPVLLACPPRQGHQGQDRHPRDQAAATQPQCFADSIAVLYGVLRWVVIKLQ